MFRWSRFARRPPPTPSPFPPRAAAAARKQTQRLCFCIESPNTPFNTNLLAEIWVTLGSRLIAHLWAEFSSACQKLSRSEHSESQHTNYIPRMKRSPAGRKGFLESSVSFQRCSSNPFFYLSPQSRERYQAQPITAQSIWSEKLKRNSKNFSRSIKQF